MAKHPAAFINAIAEEGTKVEAVKYLQETWDNYMEANRIIIMQQKIIQNLRSELGTLSADDPV